MLYIHRTIDLINVCYTDTVYRTKKEAMQAIKESEKMISYIDMIIARDDLTVDDMDGEDSYDCNEYNNFDEDSIVYRR